MHFPQQLLLPMTGAFIALSYMPASYARALPDRKQTQLTKAGSWELKSRSRAIARTQTEEKKEMPFGFDTLHLPCDMDALKLEVIIPFMPNHCIWLYNQRYVSEEFYKNFKLVQLESFFFGQYYERMRRFEMDPHEF